MAASAGPPGRFAGDLSFREVRSVNWLWTYMRKYIY